MGSDLNCAWNLTTPQIASSVGIALVAAGTWFVAYEVVNRFRGYSHKGVDVRVDGSGVGERSDEFRKWEMKRAFWMWAGLFLITLGSGLQVYGTLISSSSSR